MNDQEKLGSQVTGKQEKGIPNGKKYIKKEKGIELLIFLVLLCIPLVPLLLLFFMLVYVHTVHVHIIRYKATLPLPS